MHDPIQKWSDEPGSSQQNRTSSRWHCALPASVRAKVWDGPTRLFHWLLVILLAISWWSHPMHMDWHRDSGLAILALIIFRCIWGFAGATTARFKHFLRGPEAIARYLGQLWNRDPVKHVGHNPLGGWSVALMLAGLSTQVVSGLFSVDIDGLESGPLSDRVDFETGRWFAVVHGLSFTFLEILIGTHLCAVSFYLLYKRTNLVTPMVSGWSRLPAHPNVHFARPVVAAAAAVFASACAWWVSTGLRW
ncbi:MAG TPA: cytochrome b/b6 domain-containing protein [Sphingobium sp.]|uniref:cytochrome b/b6 domain-containing protein n=1 Tax=Sphingobium sp. TaxID=1912891 RepID=UPI002ED2E517